MKQRRILSLLLALALCVTLLPQATLPTHAAIFSGDFGAQGDNLHWSVDTQSGELVIEGSGSMGNLGLQGGPWKEYREVVRTVVVKEGVTTIGSHAFEAHKKLTSVTLPQSVTSIEAAAFQDCESLPDITLPDGLTELGKDAFWGCSSLRSMTIPDGITILRTWTFRYCSNLESIKLSENLTEIQLGAFSHCSNLRSIAIPAGVKTIEKEAFWGCGGLMRVDITDLDAWCDIDFEAESSNPLQHAKHLYVNGELLTEFTAPPELTIVKPYTFCGCKDLKEVTLPGGVFAIKKQAFFACSALERVSLPSSLSYVEDLAFCYCDSLPEITIPSTAWLGSRCFGYVYSSYYETAAPLNTFIVYGLRNSKAQGYAYRNGFRFIAIGSKMTGFRDVSELDWFNDAVYWAIHRDPPVADGVTPLLFRPTWRCSRAEIVQFLWNAAGKPEASVADNPFTDVKAGDWFYPAVMWAVANGVTKGTDATHFSPTDGCTRAEVVQFLRNAAGKSETGVETETAQNPFVDVNEDDWYYAAVLWALKNGITSGTDEAHFSPTSGCTRAEVVQFLYKQSLVQSEPEQITN